MGTNLFLGQREVEYKSAPFDQFCSYQEQKSPLFSSCSFFKREPSAGVFFKKLDFLQNVLKKTRTRHRIENTFENSKLLISIDYLSFCVYVLMFLINNKVYIYKGKEINSKRYIYVFYIYRKLDLKTATTRTREQKPRLHTSFGVAA